MLFQTGKKKTTSVLLKIWLVLFAKNRFLSMPQVLSETGSLSVQPPASLTHQRGHLLPRLPPTRSTTRAPPVRPSDGTRVVPSTEPSLSWTCAAHLSVHSFAVCLPSGGGTRSGRRQRPREAGRPRVRPPRPAGLSPRLCEHLSAFWLGPLFHIRLSHWSLSVVCVNHA